MMTTRSPDCAATQGAASVEAAARPAWRNARRWVMPGFSFECGKMVGDAGELLVAVAFGVLVLVGALGQPTLGGRQFAQKILGGTPADGQARTFGPTVRSVAGHATGRPNLGLECSQVFGLGLRSHHPPQSQAADGPQPVARGTLLDQGRCGWGEGVAGHPCNFVGKPGLVL